MNARTMGRVAAAVAALAMGAGAAQAATPPTAVTAAAPTAAVAATVPGVVQTDRRTCQVVARHPRGVLWIGDSITSQGRADIEAAMRAAGRPVCINARPGRKSAEAANVLVQYRRIRAVPPTIVMAVGTNDWHATPGVVRNQVAQVMAYSRGSQVFWVNVWLERATDPYFTQAEYIAGARRVNAEIASARYAKLYKIDWAWAASRAPQVLLKPGDMVHLTDAGSRARTDMVVRGLSRFPTWPAALR